jgi:hypothetical protein
MFRDLPDGLEGALWIVKREYILKLEGPTAKVVTAAQQEREAGLYPSRWLAAVEPIAMTSTPAGRHASGRAKIHCQVPSDPGR